jgi:hypothetical protein
MVSLKNLKKLGVMFSLGLILWANACIAQTPTANEQLGLKFDDRKWTVGWSQTNVHSRTREWVVPGESVENWHELITDEIFYGLNEQVSPTEFMDQFIASLKKVSRTATYQVINKDDQSVMFEWKTAQENDKHPKIDAQYELDRIITGKRGIYFIHYAIKDPNISQDNRLRWIKIFQSIKLQPVR